MPENLSYVQWNYQDPPAFHPFWFEKLDYDAWKEFAAENWALSYYASGLYLVLICSLKRVMKTQPPLKLKGTLIVWNLSLGLFSLLGFCRTGQELVSLLQLPDGFHQSICSRIGLNRPAAFYSVTFALSKYVELGDTIFIVLRKQKLIFLQWYHHCTSLILAWQVMPYSEPIFRWYGAINFAVHGILYPYFALKVMGFPAPRKISMIITALQLLQMVIGVAINIYSAHIINVDGPESCARDPVSIKWIGAVYASFVILFLHFFYERYLSKRTKTA